MSDQTKMLRAATAQAILKASPDAIMSVRQHVPLSDPLTMAKIAAIQAAKQCNHIIPYCYSVDIEFVGVDFQLHDDFIEVRTTVKAVSRSGMETEALAAASVAVLTLYDLLKPLDDTLEIGGIRLLSKKNAHTELKASHDRVRDTLRTGVLIISDSVSSGRKPDLCGKLIGERLRQEGLAVSEYHIVSDDTARIEAILTMLSDERRVDLILTAGGIGVGPRDNTPEAMRNIIDREVAGISEAMRAYAQERIPYAMLSRGMAGIRGKTLIINLPGSKTGSVEALEALFPFVLQAFRSIRGMSHTGDKSSPSEVEQYRYRSPDTPDTHL